MQTKKKILAGAMAVSLALGGFTLGRLTQMDVVQAAPETAAPRLSVTPSGLPSFADLADHVSPAVVHVRVVGVERASERGHPSFGRRRGGPRNPFGPQFPFPPGFGGPRPHQGVPRRSSGSGFIIRNDGLIITNNHVVEGASEIMVSLPDEREYQAKILGRDPKTDLAVLKVEAEQDLPVANSGRFRRRPRR